MLPTDKFRHLAIGLLLITAVALAAYWTRLISSVDQLRTEAASQNELTARRMALAAAVQTESLIQAIDTTLIQLRDDWLSAYPAFEASLKGAVGSLPKGAILQIGIIDERGFLAASNLGAPEKISLADREHFRIHVDGRFGDRLYVSTPLLGRRSGNWSIQLSRRMEKDGQFRGAIVASLAPEYIAAQFERFEPGQNDVIALFRQDGVYLSRTPKLSEYMGRSVQAGRPFLSDEAPLQGNFRDFSSHEPVERFFAWHRLGNLPLIAVAGLESSALTAPIEAEIRLALERNAIGSALVAMLTAAMSLLMLRIGRQQQELHDAADLYRNLFEKNTSVKLLIDPEDGRILDANTAACQYYGYPLRQLLSMRISDINALPPDAVKAEMAQARDEQRQYFNFRHRLASGELRDVEVYSGPVQLRNRTLLHSIIHDVTERRRMEESLRISQSVFDATTEGILVTDAESVIISVNPAFARITGFSAEEAIGRPASLLSSGQHTPDFFHRMFASLARDGYWEGDITNRHRNGSLYVSGVKISAVRDNAGRIVRYVALLCDVTLKKKRDEEIWHRANYDPLTDLPNRILFHDRLQQAIAQAKRNQDRVAVLFIDLDRFKEVNDSYGHPVGDELLRQVAGRLTDCLRSEDTIARIGGDEFLVLLPKVRDQEATLDIAGKILSELMQPFALHVGGKEHAARIGASIGIALFPEHAANPGSLMATADLAMYSAKSAGRGTIRVCAEASADGGHARIADPDRSSIQPAVNDIP